MIRKLNPDYNPKKQGSPANKKWTTTRQEVKTTYTPAAQNLIDKFNNRKNLNDILNILFLLAANVHGFNLPGEVFIPGLMGWIPRMGQLNEERKKKYNDAIGNAHAYVGLNEHSFEAIAYVQSTSLTGYDEQDFGGLPSHSDIVAIFPNYMEVHEIQSGDPKASGSVDMKGTDIFNDMFARIFTAIYEKLADERFEADVLPELVLKSFKKTEECRQRNGVDERK